MQYSPMFPQSPRASNPFSKRGVMIESGFDPYRENVYVLMTEYFENPKMTKIKDVNEYSMYLARIQAMLGIEFRYLIVFVYRNNEKVGQTESLQNLKWVSLQTRTMTDEHALTQHSYIPKRLPELDQKITMIDKNATQFIYRVENLPLRITLLPRPKGGAYEYNATGTVVVALETYQTIVDFV